MQVESTFVVAISVFPMSAVFHHLRTRGDCQFTDAWAEFFFAFARMTYDISCMCVREREREREEEN